MSIIRCYMSFRDGIHSARAMHMHYACAYAPLLLGNFDLATRNLVHSNSLTSDIRWYMTCGLVVHCARATHVYVRSPLTSRYFQQAAWILVHR